MYRTCPFSDVFSASHVHPPDPQFQLCLYSVFLSVPHILIVPGVRWMRQEVLVLQQPEASGSGGRRGQRTIREHKPVTRDNVGVRTQGVT